MFFSALSLILFLPFRYSRHYLSHHGLPFFAFFQQSLEQLKEQVAIHPTILPVDFDISPSTLELRLNVPIEPEPNNNKPHKTNLNVNSEPYYSSSDAENNFDYDSRTIPSKFSLQKYIYDSTEIVHQEPDYVNITLQVGFLERMLAQSIINTNGCVYSF